MNIIFKICEVRMLYNWFEVWMFCGFFLVSDIFVFVYDVVLFLYCINIIFIYECLDFILFYLLCKLDFLVFFMVGLV